MKAKNRSRVVSLQKTYQRTGVYGRLSRDRQIPPNIRLDTTSASSLHRHPVTSHNLHGRCWEHGWPTNLKTEISTKSTAKSGKFQSNLQSWQRPLHINHITTGTRSLKGLPRSSRIPTWWSKQSNILKPRIVKYPGGNITNPDSSQSKKPSILLC